MIVFLALVGVVTGGMISLTPANIEETIKATPLVMINFSASWCRYSQALKPIYEKTATDLESNKDVRLCYADCVAYPDICVRYKVNKYPTMKFLRSGELLKSEYRGQRSSDAIKNHISHLLEDPVKQLHGETQLKQAKDENKKQKFVLGYFDNTNSYSYQVFKASASIMTGQCTFYALVGDDAKSKLEELGGNDSVFLINPLEGDQKYTGSITDQPQLSAWVKETCVPIVREITFENGEELTEEGLPFVILFHDPEDTDSVAKFTTRVLEQCGDQRDSVNFLHADGFKFAHPLSHLGKSTKDLPVLAIDSFKHMYLFPKFQNIHKSGRLRRFVEDLHSGRLHREFHGEVFRDRDGEDEEPQTVEEARAKQQQQKQPKREVGTNPPESVFKKLEPNKNRYSLLNKDEL